MHRIGHIGVRGGILLAQWVGSCRAGGAARRDRCRGGGQWLERRGGLPVTGTVDVVTHRNTPITEG